MAPNSRRRRRGEEEATASGALARASSGAATSPGQAADPESEAQPEASELANLDAKQLLKKKQQAAADAAFASSCARFRLYYGALDRLEWWWIMDDAQAAIGDHLKTHGHCVLDGFLADAQASALRREVEACHRAGRLELGGLVNGRLGPQAGDAAKYEDNRTRGDLIGWFDPNEQEWPYGRELESYLVKLGTLVSQLAEHVPELGKVVSRSKAMVACYPGNGARYVKHVDNDGKHPLCSRRLLTGLIYLNDGWQQGDGGELAIFDGEEATFERKVVAPLSNRLVLFWSDWRVPHEVLPALKPRYAVTLWLLESASAAQPSDNGSGAAAAEPVAALANGGGALSSENCRGASGGASGEVDVPGPVPTPAAEPAPPDSGSALPKERQPPDAEPPGKFAAPVRYEWRQLPSTPASWELQVEVLGDTSICPGLELSDNQVRVLSGDGEPWLWLPLPSGVESGSSSSRWSRRKGLLTVTFSPSASATSGLLHGQVTSKNFTTDLQEQGWAVADGFLPGPEADTLRALVLARRQAGVLRVGRNAHEGLTASERATKNDEYTFEAAGSDAGPLKDLASRCNQLVLRLMRQGPPELRQVQLVQGRPMLAVYPGDGARYGRHLDAATWRPGGDNGRVLTIVVYLNPFWQPGHGGELRLLQSLDDNAARGHDVQPLHGRLVAFLCKDRCPHEVLPCWGDRVAVTVWYYDGERLNQRFAKGGGDIAGFAFEGGEGA